MSFRQPSDDKFHETLVESSLPLLYAAYDEAVHNGIVDPAIFLVDCEDALGAEMAAAWVGEDAVDNAVELEQLARGKETGTTVLARAVSLADCRREVPAVYPYLAAALEEGPPEGEFFVICVTEGGAAALSVPASEREQE